MAIVLERKGAFAEAEQLLRTAVIQGRRSLGEGDFNVALLLRTLGGVRLVRGDPGEAEDLFRRALEMLHRTFPKDHPDEGDILNRLAYCVVIRGAGDLSEIYRQATAFENARPATGPFFVTDGYEYLAEAARRMGDRALAERLYRRALELYERQLPNGHPYRAGAAVGLGKTLLDLGRPADAAEYLREGLAQWKAAQLPEPRRVAEVNALLARSAQ